MLRLQGMAERNSSIQNLAFLAGVAVGSCLTLFAAKYLSSFQSRREETEIGEEIATLSGNCKKKDEFPELRVSELFESGDEVIIEQFTRNIQFFGREGQLQIHRSFVVVIGLGGVGSHAVNLLLRSGIGRIRIVDFDLVSVSSLNRHSVATRSDVGTPKAVCLKKHFSDIFPEAQIDARTEMFTSENADLLLSGSPDFVLDCIDNIDTKVALLASCVKKQIRVLCATGAGARSDPTRIRIADISESTMDPLARAVRSRLKRDHGIDSGIPVVFSTEKPKVKLLPFQAQPESQSNASNGISSQNPLDYQIVPGFRVRILPVLGTIPAIFGQSMATYVLTNLAGFDVSYEPVFNLNDDQYIAIRQRLVEREELCYGSSGEVNVDLWEVCFLVREIWHGKSARAQDRTDPGKGFWKNVNNLMLTRWDSELPPTIDNLILLTFEEAELHESTSLQQLKVEEPGFFKSTTEILSRVWNEY